MKNLILTLTILCLGIVTQAHNIITIGCGTNGRVKVKGTQFDFRGTKLDSVVLYVTTNGQAPTANGSNIKWKGSIFTIDDNGHDDLDGTFTMDTMPYFSPTGQTVYIKEYERNNTNSNSTYSLKWSGSAFVYSNCSVMPITLTSWTATVDENDSALVHMAWSVDMENNVSYYRIDGSTDHGLTWDTGIAKLNSLGDTNLKRTYTLEYRNPFIGMIAKTAGIGTFGIVVLIAVFAGSLRNRALAGTVACLMIVATIACKKDVTAPKQGLKYNAVKLNEVDNDGSVKDFATRQLKHK